MGLLDRILGGLNKVDDVRTDVEDAVFRDRRYDRAEELETGGAAVEGVVAGVHFLHTDDATEGRYRVEWRGPEPQSAGIRCPGVVPACVRLGASVPLRVDGDRAVLDADLITATLGLPAQPGLSMRSAPDPGISDRSLNSDVLRGLDRWPRERAVVTGLEPVSGLLGATENHDVHLRLADGTAALVRRAWVPPYVRALLAPAVDVPVAVHPQDRTRVFVDWCGLATERAGGTWRDPVPDDSAARQQAAAREPATPTLTTPTTPAGPGSMAPPDDSLAPIEGVSIETAALVDVALQTARVVPADQPAWMAAEFGVPEGRWQPVRAAWEARIRADWRVGMVYGEATTAARKELERRRKGR